MLSTWHWIMCKLLLQARSGALAVLNALLEGSKQYLMAAEDRYGMLWLIGDTLPEPVASSVNIELQQTLKHAQTKPCCLLVLLLLCVAHCLATWLIMPLCGSLLSHLACHARVAHCSPVWLVMFLRSEQYKNAPFTPFSVTLGFMIKEIHRCLLLALASEVSPLAITQIIKVRNLLMCVLLLWFLPGVSLGFCCKIRPLVFDLAVSSNTRC